MAVINHFEKIATLLAGGWGEPPVIEDEEIDARECLEEASIASVAAGTYNFVRIHETLRITPAMAANGSKRR